MSLRDSLLKAGVVNKKDAQRVELQLRAEKKAAVGNQISKAERERQEREEAERVRREREEELLARRREARARQEQEIRLMSSRQILRSHSLRFRSGPQRFWYKAPVPPEIWRMDLPERIANDLRCGYLAIAWCDDQNPDVVVIDRKAAERVHAIRPELILFWNADGGDRDPAEQLWKEY